MDRYLENIEHKAAVLCDALPYIRDFVNKIIVVEYDCGEWLSGCGRKETDERHCSAEEYWRHSDRGTPDTDGRRQIS